MPQVTDPAAQRFLEMFGGDVNKALARGLVFNNRLKTFQAAHPEEFQPGGAADPNIQPDLTAPLYEEPEAPEAAPPVAEGSPDWGAVAEEAKRYAREEDPTCAGITQQWINNDKAIRETGSQVKEKSVRISAIDTILKDTTFEIPELKAEDLRDEKRTLVQEIASLKQDAMLRILHNRDLDQQYQSRETQIYNHLAGQYQQQFREQAVYAEFQRIENEEYQRLSTSWPGALARAAANSKIPDDLRGDFETYARQMASAALSSPDFIIDDVDSFMSAVAAGYVKRLDTYHRAQAAQYGTLAHARAAAPSPVAPPGTPAPPQPPQRPNTPEEAMQEASRYLRERLRG